MNKAYLRELNQDPRWAELIKSIEIDVKRSNEYKSSDVDEKKKIHDMIFYSGWNKCAGQIISTLREVNYERPSD